MSALFGVLTLVLEPFFAVRIALAFLREVAVPVFSAGFLALELTCISFLLALELGVAQLFDVLQVPVVPVELLVLQVSILLRICILPIGELDLILVQRVLRVFFV